MLSLLLPNTLNNHHWFNCEDGQNSFKLAPPQKRTLKIMSSYGNFRSFSIFHFFIQYFAFKKNIWKKVWSNNLSCPIRIFVFSALYFYLPLGRFSLSPSPSFFTSSPSPTSPPLLTLPFVMALVRESVKKLEFLADMFAKL